MSKYKPYPKYKESGVAWLGDVPEGWEVGLLSSLFLNNKEKNIGMKNNNLLSLSYGRIVQKNIDTDKGLLPANFESYQIVYNGYVILRLTDLQNDKKSLRVGFVKEKGIITSAYVGLAKKSKSIGNEKYFYYYLHSFDLHKGFYGMGAGVRQGLNFDELKKLRITLPPIDEQNQIVEYIEEKTKKIDTLIEKQQTLIKLLKEKRQALVDNALNEKNIKSIHLNRVIYQIQRPVYREKNKLYTTLGLYNRGRGLFHRDPKEEEELGESDFYWVEDGDLILSGQFAWEGAIALAKKSENACIASHRFPIIRGKENVLNTKYLWAFFTTQLGNFILNEHSVGSAGRNRPLNMNTLLKEKIPVPSMKLQLEVAKIVEIEQLIHIKIKKEIELLKERRTALISAVVTGKVDVR
jgi:type I restriction enzyme S subunit